MPEKSIFEMVMPDPVLAAYELPLRATYYPFGFPLELATNSAHVLEAAAEGWGEFTQQFHAAPVRMHLGVAPGSNTHLPPTSTFRSREHLMFFVADSENFMVCDFNQGFGFGWTTESVAADHALVRYRFLTAAGLSLIEQQAFASMHCGLVVRNGCGVAFFGDSLAGKSTLSYACARAGWTFVSDDGIFLVRNSSYRYAVGDPYTLRLRADAKPLFPELQDRIATTRPNGKEGIEIFTRELPIQVAPGCTIDHIVFLNRDQPGPARVRRYPKDDAQQWCQRYATFGVPGVRQAQAECYERLLRASIWEMCYSDLDDAVARLERLVDSGG
jgi:hypothetical protein